MNDSAVQRWLYLLAVPSVLMVLSAGCARPPTEKPVYTEARRAIEAYDGLPVKSKVLPIDKSKLFIGKSAARADLMVKTQDASGKSIEKPFTVQLKRVARTWVAQNVSPTPGSEGFPADKPADGQDLLTP